MLEGRDAAAEVDQAIRVFEKFPFAVSPVR
jgi:hypothetical protein